MYLQKAIQKRKATTDFSEVNCLHFGFTTQLFPDTTNNVSIYEVWKLFHHWPLVFGLFFLSLLVARDVVTPLSSRRCDHDLTLNSGNKLTRKSVVAWGRIKNKIFVFHQHLLSFQFPRRRGWWRWGSQWREGKKGWNCSEGMALPNSDL